MDNVTVFPDGAPSTVVPFGTPVPLTAAPFCTTEPSATVTVKELVTAVGTVVATPVIAVLVPTTSAEPRHGFGLSDDGRRDPASCSGNTGHIFGLAGDQRRDAAGGSCDPGHIFGRADNDGGNTCRGGRHAIERPLGARHHRRAADLGPHLRIRRGHDADVVERVGRTGEHVAVGVDQLDHRVEARARLVDVDPDLAAGVARETVDVHVGRVVEGDRAVHLEAEAAILVA